MIRSNGSSSFLFADMRGPVTELLQRQLYRSLVRAVSKFLRIECFSCHRTIARGTEKNVGQGCPRAWDENSRESTRRNERVGARALSGSIFMYNSFEMALLELRGSPCTPTGPRRSPEKYQRTPEKRTLLLGSPNLDQFRNRLIEYLKRMR